MALVDDLKIVIDDILTDFAPNNRTAYLRTTTKVGDTLLGRSVSVTNTDTLLDPQPVYRRLGSNQPGSINEDLFLSGNEEVAVDQWVFVLSVNAITRAQLLDKNTVLVLKDASLNEEVFKLIDFSDPGINSTTVAYIAYYKSVDRP